MVLYFYLRPIFGVVSGMALGGILAVLFSVRWWFFPLFQMLHIAMDSFMRYEHQPLVPFHRWKYFGKITPGSRTEFILSTLLFLAVLWLL